MSILSYILGLALFTISVWTFELVWIVFAIVLRNRKFISFLYGLSSIITSIYALLLCMVAFINLVDKFHLFWGIVISILLGGIIFSLASIPAFLANLPFVLLATWAEEKLPPKPTQY